MVHCWKTTMESICRPVYFTFERARAPGHFLLVKGTLWGNCKFLLEHFKRTKALTRGHGGNNLCCLHLVSGLNLSSKYKATCNLAHWIIKGTCQSIWFNNHQFMQFCSALPQLHKLISSKHSRPIWHTFIVRGPTSLIEIVNHFLSTLFNHFSIGYFRRMTETDAFKAW